jgi:hypothetical protein
MKHLRKFEDLDYKDKLAAETKLRQDFEKSEEEETERKRGELGGKFLPEIQKDSQKRKSSELEEEERGVIIQRVIDGLKFDMRNNPGYQSFKEELLAFLDEFPKE